jgi:hypothetical protein
MIHSDSLTRKVVEFVHDNPGVTRANVLEALPDETKARTVSSIFNYLARTGAIENRGRSGLAARWFPITITVGKMYRDIARTLLAELKTVHHSQREDYLAKRLQEIFGGSKN